MTGPVRVGVIAEDFNFASFLVPVIVAEAGRAGAVVRVFRPEITSGCQP